MKKIGLMAYKLGDLEKTTINQIFLLFYYRNLFDFWL